MVWLGLRVVSYITVTGVITCKYSVKACMYTRAL